MKWISENCKACGTLIARGFVIDGKAKSLYGMGLAATMLVGWYIFMYWLVSLLSAWRWPHAIAWAVATLLVMVSVYNVITSCIYAWYQYHRRGFKAGTQFENIRKERSF